MEKGAVTDTPTATFGREILTSALLDEMMPLLSSHWAEVAPYRDIPLDIDRGLYLSLEEYRILRVYTIRREGKLVGYCSMLVKTHLHYKTVLFASCDTFYVAPDERGRMLGSGLVSFVKSKLRDEGVVAVMISIPEGSLAGKILERNAFSQIENWYSARLN